MNESMQADRMLTLDECAHALGISNQKALKLAKAKAFPLQDAVKVGCVYRVPCLSLCESTGLAFETFACGKEA